MVLIKILSVILLAPSFYVISKLMRKKELNFFDLLLLFSTLFFVIIPIKSDIAVFDTIGLILPEISLLVFYYLLFFFIFLVFLSKSIRENNPNPINITYFLKTYPKIQGSLILKIFLIVLPIFSITYYVPQMSLLSAFNEIREAGSHASYEESSMVKFFASIFNLGMIITLKIFFQKIDEKKIDIYVILSLVLYLVNLVMLPRRQLILFCLFAALLFYSNNRYAINKKFLLTFSLISFFLYSIYFPFYNIIRRSPVEFNLKNPIESITAIYDYGVSSYTSAKEDAADLTDSRAIGLYRAIYWLARYDTSEDVTWGAITMAAIDHAIPKIINPDKGLGSELILEKRIHSPHDSADSVLLLALADYSILGPLFCILFYLGIYYLLYLISSFSEVFFGKTIIMYYFVFFIFQFTFSIEQKLDGMIANSVAFTILIIPIAILQKLNVLSLNTNKTSFILE